ncbi:MAG TPA: SDR family oxidoreductase [Acidimicrobiales bacterium]
MTRRLTGRVALVVGGSNERRPFDAAMKRALLAEGAHVLVADALSSPTSVVERCVASHGRLDAVFVTDAAHATRWAPEVAPQLARDNGALVALVSMRALAGDLTGRAESVDGGATIALVRSLATEYGRAGLRANCVAVLPDDVPVSELARHTLVDVPTTDDVARVAVFLASDDAAFVTGQVLRCDGGLLSHLPHLAMLRDAATETVRQRRDA